MKVSNEVMNIYGNDGDQFDKVAIDSSGNVICAGTIGSEGTGSHVGILIIKYDINLNVLVRKVYGGSGGDRFGQVTTDSNNNVICVGYTLSGRAGDYDTLVVKFDSDLNLLARKTYGGIILDEFSAVATDSNDNVICAGYTTSEDNCYHDALVVKFSGTDLSILARKVYGGTVIDMFRGVTTDTNGNIICTGYTRSEGSGYDDTLVVKYDSNLNVLARKSYGGYVFDYFYGVATDTNNDIICVGYTTGEGSGNDDALVVKFSGSDLSILAKKVYGGTINDRFRGVATDSDDNIICTGHTTSEGDDNGNVILVVKFDSDLNVLARKTYGGIDDDDHYLGVTIDPNGNIIYVGRTISEETNDYTPLVVKYYTPLVVKFQRRLYQVATDTNGNVICTDVNDTDESDSHEDAVVVNHDEL
jgi:uncharacterized delta-60 repeat protein